MTTSEIEIELHLFETENPTSIITEFKFFSFNFSFIYLFFFLIASDLTLAGEDHVTNRIFKLVPFAVMQGTVKIDA